MDIAKLSVERREETGKGSAGRLRRSGRVPAVLYGPKADPLHLSVSARELGTLIQQAGAHPLVELQVAGGRKKPQAAMVKEIQRPAVKPGFHHIDFLAIELDQEIDSQVPVQLKGEASGVKDGGVLQHVLWQIGIRAVAREMPDSIELDISELQIGSALRVSDITPPKGAQFLSNPDELVVTVVPPAKEPEAEEEVPELEEEMAEPELIQREQPEEAEAEE